MEKQTEDDGRTETQRFSDDVDSTELIEGDRISRDLVARVPEQLGDSIRPTAPESDETAPKTRLVAVTAIRDMEDSHSALLVDPDAGIIIRAGRIDRNSAMTQAEADWTVREVGDSVTVDGVSELTVSDGDDPVEDAQAYVGEWAELLFGDAASGHFDYDDERSLSGSTLTMEDFDGRKAVATISLEDSE
jgi:hypothetical protein